MQNVIPVIKECLVRVASDDRMARIENKLDQLIGGQQTIIEDKACFFCRSQGHLANGCPYRKHCVGCTSDLHPYD